MYLKRCEIVNNQDGTYTITGRCILTHKLYMVVVKAKELQNWKNGELIQKAMPDVSIDDREFLISGISPSGFARCELKNRN
jgi:hypothetical protein